MSLFNLAHRAAMIHDLKQATQIKPNIFNSCNRAKIINHITLFLSLLTGIFAPIL